ncbi:hypothetical protein D3C85_1156820 [compost metagenome]
MASSSWYSRSSLSNSGRIALKPWISRLSRIQSSTRCRLRWVAGGLTPSSSRIAATIDLTVSILPSRECTARASFSIWRSECSGSHSENCRAQLRSSTRSLSPASRLRSFWMMARNWRVLSRRVVKMPACLKRRPSSSMLRQVMASPWRLFT